GALGDGPSPAGGGADVDDAEGFVGDGVGVVGEHVDGDGAALEGLGPVGADGGERSVGSGDADPDDAGGLVGPVVDPHLHGPVSARFGVEGGGELEHGAVEFGGDRTVDVVDLDGVFVVGVGIDDGPDEVEAAGVALAEIDVEVGERRWRVEIAV